jgi:hypothetical protein
VRCHPVFAGQRQIPIEQVAFMCKTCCAHVTGAGWARLLHPNPYPYPYVPVASTHTGLQTRDIPYASEINLELQDGLAIDDVTRQAFSILGENGLIHAADQHKCQECTQPYRKTADIITEDDPAALVGMDKN